jgi:hypothetical protein
MKKHGTHFRTVVIGSLVALASACSTGPNDAGEASLVPWSRISGRLIYSRICGNNCGVLFLADGATKQVSHVYTSGASPRDRSGAGETRSS